MRLALALSALFLLSSTAAPAAIHNVPGDYSTIANAMAAAGTGDVIQLGAGTYSAATTGDTFPIQLNIDGIELRGVGMGVTILDAAGAGSAIVFDAPTGAIADLTVTGGANTDRGGGVQVLQGSPEISGLFVYDNGARIRGSGINAQGTASPWIHHNVIWANYDTDLVHSGDPHGIQVSDSATGTVEHNLIGLTDSNGLFYLNSAAPVVRNNIFYRNGTPGVRGRGICALGSGSAVVAYNLFYDNAISAIVINSGGFQDLSAADANDFSLSDGIFGNLDGDPDFIDEAGFDFNLVFGSPAIDNGDPTSTLDPDGTTADIGPFFYDQSVSSVPDRLAAAALLPNVPNPFNPATDVRIALDTPTFVELDVIDARGRFVRSLHRGVLPEGISRLRWDGRSEEGMEVVSGVYFSVMRADDAIDSQAMVLVR